MPTTDTHIAVLVSSCLQLCDVWCFFLQSIIPSAISMWHGDPLLFIQDSSKEWIRFHQYGFAYLPPQKKVAIMNALQLLTSIIVVWKTYLDTRIIFYMYLLLITVVHSALLATLWSYTVYKKLKLTLICSSFASIKVTQWSYIKCIKN